MEENSTLESQDFRCHNAIEPYECRQCPSFHANLLLHLKIHMKHAFKASIPQFPIYRCDRCQFETYSKLLLTIHKEFNKCLQKIGHTTFRNQWNKTSENGSLQCKFCLARFKVKRNLELHMDYWYHCQLCTFKTEHKNHLEKHVLLKHLPEHEVRYFRCEHCLQKFHYKSSQELESHLKKYHSKCKDMRWFKCEKCPFRSIVKASLKEHIETQHENLPNSDTLSKLQPPRRRETATIDFQCDYCSYKTKKKYMLQRHLTNHLSETQINWHCCQQCPLKFKRRQYLTKHVKIRHSNPEDIQWLRCAHCPAIFKQRSNLRHHVLLRHTNPENIRWYKCEECPARFKVKSNLGSHILCRHTKPEDIQWFKCELCLAKFKQKSNLKNHVRAVH